VSELGLKMDPTLWGVLEELMELIKDTSVSQELEYKISAINAGQHKFKEMITRH
jgi:hypothetical protein